MIAAAVAGFLLGGTLIVAIGAQNAFVIRQGVTGQHVFWICLFCAASDALLIWSGVFGLGAVVKTVPAFVPVMTYGGAAFLVWYGTRGAAPGLVAGSHAREC
jgi:L-lysine exporter family protein LysE/ArgO